MALELPRARLSGAPQLRRRDVPVDQILAVLGRNPYAEAMNNVRPLLSDALAKRAALRREVVQAKEIQKILQSDGRPPDQTSLSPSLLLDAEKARHSFNKTGNRYLPVGGGSIFDTETQGFLTDGNLNDRHGEALRGANQQSPYVDSADGIPLIFDRDNQRYIRADTGQEARGKIVPAKGNNEAVSMGSRAAVMMPKVKYIFDKLDDMGEVSARMALTPGIGNVFFPVINQMKNELLQVGFTFGGKNFTGNEASIIAGAMVPGAFDNKESRALKRTAINGYISGQLDLLQAANLLGAGGSVIKEIIKANDPNNSLSVDSVDSNAVPTVGQTFNGEKVIGVKRVK